MLFVDTHTHLYLTEFDSDRKQVVENAIQEGITRMFLPNIDVESIEPLKDLAKNFPSNCFPMMGLHPTSVKEDYQNQLNTIKAELIREKYIAIGEIGIDLYWDKTFKEQQIDAFAQQINWAAEMDLPIVIHARESFNEIFMELERLKHLNVKGVFHSFTGNAEQAQKAIDLGFYIGINGIITFKNAGLDKVVRGIDLKNILLETDSPYLAPVPNRGKRNESKNLRFTAQKIAEIHNLSIEELALITTNNALSLFQL